MRTALRTLRERLAAAFGAAPVGWDTPEGLAILRSLCWEHRASEETAEALRAQTREQLLVTAEPTLAPIFQEPTP